MKKIITILLALILVGCSSNNNNSSNTGTVLPEKSTTSTTETNVEEQKNQTTEASTEQVTLSKGETKTIKSTYSYTGTEIEGEFTFEDQWISNELVPPEPIKRFYHHYTAVEGETFVIAKYKVKNLGGEAIDHYELTNFLSDSEASLKVVADGKYVYNGDIVYEEVNADGEYDLPPYPEIDPLKTATIYFVASIPEEAKEMPMQISICFGDTEILLK